ncbi:hypothetical protein FSP39_023892 [Pinctada imbricata]|uniref:Carboxylesterase type B domain-containing protein n=1 Tax=Pinctada imbricata TaxID=66713 RepID=A0AA88Y7T5_PINIB|nr:hypothetical protein FSP39_023892 [Pinctada imbricata]
MNFTYQKCMPLLFLITCYEFAQCTDKDLRVSKRIFTSTYGVIQGMIKEYPEESELTSVDNILGIMYASTRNTRLRFLPPSSPLDKWLDTRVAFTFRAVCQQDISIAERLKARGPPHKIKQFILRNRNSSKSQTEDCLTLNLYIPSRGKICLASYVDTCFSLVLLCI